ncbi:MAG: NAD(P)/FAD-dependent oxidoreductase [Candidatus Dormibacteraeota bacterium]|nr:NAD(P)/FAD-dependent oxidoreductase [Candidatus Dormibacteraeota bacterium]
MATRLDAQVIVVGAGPVGSVLAMLLGRSGVTTLVLEKASFPRDKACGEGLMPGGVAVLEGLGIDLAREGFPQIGGVAYRTPGVGTMFGAFRAGPGLPGHGFGVRRVRFDALLAERAATTPNVDLRTGCAVKAIERTGTRFQVETSGGPLTAERVVGADGLRSTTRRLLGWSKPHSRPHRHALVSHLAVPRHSVREVYVTVLPGNEVYVAPSGPDEVLAIVLGTPGNLRAHESSVVDSYRRTVATAHPEFGGAECGRIRGAGPFRVSSRTVAEGGAFLAGDAAGFIDPITGDAMSAGFRAASYLAELLAGAAPGAEARYRRWYGAQWRTRWLVTAIALGLSGSPRLARRALDGLGRHPDALEPLLEVNSGFRGLASVPLRTWSALAGV